MPPLQHDFIQSIFKDSLTSSQAALQASKESAKERVKEGILLIERLLPYCCAVLYSFGGGFRFVYSPCVCWRTPWKGRRLALAWIRRDDAEMFDPTKFQGFLLCVCRRCVCSPPTRQMMMMMMVARKLLTKSNNTNTKYISFVGSTELFILLISTLHRGFLLHSAFAETNLAL